MGPDLRTYERLQLVGGQADDRHRVMGKALTDYGAISAWIKARFNLVDTKKIEILI